MDMGNISMRFGEFHDEILKNLLKRGVVKTKCEAIRNALTEYGERHGAVKYAGGIAIRESGNEDLWNDLLKISFKGKEDLSERLDEIVYK
jgi:Arc/MetJ-type ribon-helix-helix transcriptional regulator